MSQPFVGEPIARLSVPPPHAPTASPFGWSTSDSWASGSPQAQAAPPPPPRPYRVHDETLWRAARDDYAAGHGAEAVCARYNLNLSTFRQRARREGWRRSDAETPLPEPLGAEVFAPEPAPPTDQLVDLAWRAAAEAIGHGKVYPARAWMKLWRELKAVAAEEAAAAAGPAPAPPPSAREVSAKSLDALAQTVRAVRQAATALRARSPAAPDEGLCDEDFCDDEEEEEEKDDLDADADDLDPGPNGDHDEPPEAAPAADSPAPDSPLHPLHSDCGAPAYPSWSETEDLLEALAIEANRGVHSPALAAQIERVREAIDHSAERLRQGRAP